MRLQRYGDELRLMCKPGGPAEGRKVIRGSKQNSRPTAGEVRKLRHKPSRRGSGSGFTGSSKSKSQKKKKRRREKEIDEAKGKSEGKGVDGQPADTQRRAKRLVWRPTSS